MIIKIHDTGYVNDEFTVSDTALPLYGSATTAQKSRGEFRANNTLELKITDIIPKFGNSGFSLPNRNSLKSKQINIALNPISFDISCFIEKPPMGLVSGSPDLKDLEKYKELILMTLSKGHKDLYLVSNTTVDNSILLPLYYLINIFGKTDAGNPDSKKHLNIDIINVDFPDNVDNAKMQITISCLLLPNFE